MKGKSMKGKAMERTQTVMTRDPWGRPNLVLELVNTVMYVPACRDWGYSKARRQWTALKGSPRRRNAAIPPEPPHRFGTGRFWRCPASKIASAYVTVFTSSST